MSLAAALDGEPQALSSRLGGRSTFTHGKGGTMERVDSIIARILVNSVHGKPKQEQKQLILKYREHGVLTDAETAAAISVYGLAEA